MTGYPFVAARPISIVRPEDLLVLKFEFVNLKLNFFSDPLTLVRAIKYKPAYIIVEFQPQNIAEQAFFESDADFKLPPDDPDNKFSVEDMTLPVGSQLSGPSRLVFRVPTGADPIPYTIEGLLKVCGEYELNVAGTALPPEEPPGSPPTPNFSDYLMTRVPALKRAHHYNIPITGNATTKISDTTVKLSSAQKLMLESRVKAWHAQSALPRYMPRTYDSAMVKGGKYATHIHIKKPKLHKPSDKQTCIEAPFRLIISPSIYGAWAHSDTPVKSPKTERTEMWHTRLGVRSKDKDGKFYADEREDNERRTVRAIWTRDKEFDKDNWEKVPDHLNDPFRMSLDAADRHNIVHLSCNYYILAAPTGGLPYMQTRKEFYKPLPIQVEQLMLTSLGAWMNVHGAWDPPGALTVEEWRHRGTMGRDNYVRVVYQGYLFPFGHRASLIKVTERKFHPKSEYPDIPGNIAYLRQRMFIVVREPDKIFVNPTLKTPDGHYYDLQMPFTRVRITTLVTPNLDNPSLKDPTTDTRSDYGGKEQSLFWPRVGENDFLFHLIAECTDGKEVEFTAPLVFADSKVARDDYLMKTVKEDYETNIEPEDRENRRKRPMNGQNVIFADSAEPGDTNSEGNSNTRFEVESLTFGAEIPDDTNLAKLGSDHPRFYPAVRKAKIFIPAIKHLVGNNFKATVIKYHETYLKYGFDDTSENNGEVFAQLDTDNEIPLNFNSKGDRSGGLVKPNMKITGLSRIMGPVAGDLEKLAGGAFDPTDFFGAIDAKMFGVIPLKEIVEGLDSELATQPDRVPKFIMENQTAMNAFLQDLEYLKENVEFISSVGALSMFPHRSNLKLMGLAFYLLSRAHLPMYGMATSISSLTFITDYSRLDEAVSTFLKYVDLPPNHAPFRQEVHMIQKKR